MLLHYAFRSHQLLLHLLKELDDYVVFGVHCLPSNHAIKLCRPSPSNCICNKGKQLIVDACLEFNSIPLSSIHLCIQFPGFRAPNLVQVVSMLATKNCPTPTFPPAMFQTKQMSRENSSSAQKTRTWLSKKLSSSQDSTQKRQLAPTTERKLKQFGTSMLWSGATCRECTELDEATPGVVIGAEVDGLGVELLDVGHQVTPLH
ncbi:hypothetical protein TIFTF001_030926 [Ficus carica]|uniref:Uncharacterized protein n=1 Tax=Ficus carica TaxID=3494 RepID=A0AA88DUC2_FICCA|nr:hypothetical protein TIFTF001_030926 [Ficus carica]